MHVPWLCSLALTHHYATQNYLKWIMKTLFSVLHLVPMITASIQESQLDTLEDWKENKQPKKKPEEGGHSAAAILKGSIGSLGGWKKKDSQYGWVELVTICGHRFQKATHIAPLPLSQKENISFAITKLGFGRWYFGKVQNDNHR